MNSTQRQALTFRQLISIVRWPSPYEGELARLEPVYKLSCTLKKLLHDAKAILQAERQHADC